jgi:hypothetical protein
MENVDRRLLPVVAKPFPTASLLARGHVLVAVNGFRLDDKNLFPSLHEPFATALDLLAVS